MKGRAEQLIESLEQRIEKVEDDISGAHAECDELRQLMVGENMKDLADTVRQALENLDDVGTLTDEWARKLREALSRWERGT